MRDTVRTGASKVLLLGASGLLGSTLGPELLSRGFTVYSASSSGLGTDLRFDIRDLNSVTRILREVQPDFIINLAGLTSVDGCETNPEQALLLNTSANLNISLSRQIIGLPFRIIYVSTDHVYDSPGMSSESERVKLLNLYAKTKFMGEKALDSDWDIAIRTNFVGRSKSGNRESLTDWLISVAKSGEEAKLLSDVYFSPVSMSTVSRAISQVLSRPVPGLFNVGSTTYMSKADFDLEFLGAIGLGSSNFSRVTIENANFLIARRPANMAMDSSKFQDIMGFSLPTIEQVIQDTAEEYLG